MTGGDSPSLVWDSIKRCCGTGPLQVAHSLVRVFYYLNPALSLAESEAMWVLKIIAAKVVAVAVVVTVVAGFKMIGRWLSR